MARNQVYDGATWVPLDLPYNRVMGELDETPRFIAGNNTFVSLGGKCVKRPGLKKVADACKSTGRIPERLWIYETLDNPPYVYVLGSFYNSVTGKYQLEYIRLDAAIPAWTSAGTLRGLDKSRVPHEAVVKRGRVYIKGFPAAADDTEKLGSVQFDGTGGVVTVSLWGLLGPTSPTALSNPAGWPASTHSVTVNIGWKYTYAYVTRTGQISNRAPLQTNPDKNPSVSGPFSSKIPQVTITGHSDTANVPYINVYRTTDGGGTFFFLKQVANPGAGTFLFEDKYLESGAGGGTFNDPLPDADLDTTQVAPTTVSNSPPPSVAAPKVIGVDTIEYSTPVVEYAGRLWFAIGQYLYFSALEEINDGVGEESWPAGTRAGNFFRFQYPVMNLGATADALYVFTLQATYRITGNSKETFAPRPFLAQVGAPYGHPRSAISLGEQVVWLTQDYRIAMAGPSGFTILSDPLFTDLTDAVAGLGKIQLLYWAELDKEFLVVFSHRPDTPTESRQWVYDLKKSTLVRSDFWNTPWTMKSVCAVSGRLYQNVSNRRLVVAVSDGTDATLAYMDPTGRTGQDFTPDGENEGFTFYFNTSLISVPVGNHVNSTRKPGLTGPVCHYIVLDRSLFPGDTDPSVYYFRDDFWTDPVQTKDAVQPWRRPDSKAYRTLMYPVVRAGQRFAVKVQKVNSSELFELHTLSLIWNPEGGA